MHWLFYMLVSSLYKRSRNYKILFGNPDFCFVLKIRNLLILKMLNTDNILNPLSILRQCIHLLKINKLSVRQLESISNISYEEEEG